MRWAAFLKTKDNPASWKCEYCEEKGLQSKRNCEGNLDGHCASHGTIKYEDMEFSETSGRALCPKCSRALQMPFELVLGKAYRIFQCPLNEVDREALHLISLVNWSESTGQLPSGRPLLQEANWYYELREFVVVEQDRIREEFFSQKQNPSPHGQGKIASKALRRR